ncbi:MAG: type II secretion system protein [Deltaproteobacteria bacterium]|nr:type II secretion system protein [Deltaproteobacteria bacterium]
MGAIIKSHTIRVSGFTLLEILIAMFILGIVLSTIFTIFTGTIKNITYAESQADIYQMARVALQRIQEDLECSLILKEDETLGDEKDSSIPGSFAGKNETIDDKDADTLSFHSSKHLSMDDEDKDPGLARITFYVKENEDEEGLDLYRTDVSEREQAPEEKTGGLILCEGLHSVNLMYYNSNGDEYESWDSSEEEFKDKLPAMVSIQLKFLDESNPEEPLKFGTSIALPMARDEYGEASKDAEESE